MNEKKSFGKKLDNFFAGKGFYIVLFLCVAVIGVSTYFLLTNRGTSAESLTTLTPQPTPHIETPAIVPEPPVVEEPIEEVPEAEPMPETANDALSEADVWSEADAQAAVAAQYVWPVNGEISLPYSVVALIYNSKMGDWRTHDGIDIASTLGTQVVAVASGTVVSVAKDDINGTSVTIEHAGGLRSVYCNLAEIPTVYEGDSVMTGEVIGAVGATALGETAENPHLCLKMRLDGVSVDPTEYLPPR